MRMTEQKMPPKRKSYSADYKLQVVEVEVAAQNSNWAAETKFCLRLPPELFKSNTEDVELNGLSNVKWDCMVLIKVKVHLLCSLGHSSVNLFALDKHWKPFLFMFIFRVAKYLLCISISYSYAAFSLFFYYGNVITCLPRWHNICFWSNSL